MAPAWRAIGQCFRSRVFESTVCRDLEPSEQGEGQFLFLSEGGSDTIRVLSFVENMNVYSTNSQSTGQNHGRQGEKGPESRGS